MYALFHFLSSKKKVLHIHLNNKPGINQKMIDISNIIYEDKDLKTTEGCILNMNHKYF